MYKKKEISLLIVTLAFSYIICMAFTHSIIPPGLAYGQNSGAVEVKIAKGSSDPNNGQFFVPSEVSVSKGGQVIWTNDDNAVHTVVQGSPSKDSSSSQPQFSSDLIQAGDKFQHTFTDSGTIDYYCTLHPWMTGKVTVS
ncbi:MAG TPA: plastocyanin/azurin family copper-binding protein [Nitrososphaeraceae archaeon]|nr:plastocyanin/azurin family copper-binding protein [Nitrososphaeraceae archaeon]